MKVLFITPIFPLPSNSGGAIAILKTLRCLLPLCELHLLSPSPETNGNANLGQLQELLPGALFHFYRSRERQHTPRLEMYSTAVRSMVTRQSYWASNWMNPHLRSAVQQLMTEQGFDIVHCDWLESAVPLIGLHLPIVLRTLDVHFVNMLEWADGLPLNKKLRRSFWQLQAKRFRAFEIDILSAAPAVVTLSAEDEAILRSEGISNAVTIPPPYLVETEMPKESRKDGRCLALFLGRLDMVVNHEAFFSFTDNIWPHVSDDCRTQVKIIFAGGFPDEKVRRRAGQLGLEIQGPLSDEETQNLLAEADIFIAPVKSGTGIKIKTLEAMAHGKPIIGYPNAFRGVPVEHNENALIAETPVMFARWLELLAYDPDRRRQLGAAAREFVRVSFDPAVLGSRLMGLYAQVAESFPLRNS